MTAKVSEMHDSLWNQILSALGERLPATTLESWVRPCRLTTLDGDHLHVAAPNTFTRDWIEQHHRDTIAAAARIVLGGDSRVSIESDPEPERSAMPQGERAPIPPAEDLPARYTFQSFVVG